MKSPLALTILLMILCSFGKKNNNYNSVQCQSIIDFSYGKNINIKDIIVFVDTVEDIDKNLLVKLLGDSVVNKRLISSKKRESFCDLPEHFKICQNQSTFDSLSYLYETMENYDVWMSSEMLDTAKYPQKIQLNFIPIKVGKPVYFGNFAVIRRSVGDSKNAFLYERKGNRWYFSKLLVHPDH